MKTIYIVRHGQTYINQFNKIQGWSDAPLTRKGEEQAIATGKALAHLKFDAVFASDTKRATDTAKFIMAENKANSNLKLITTKYFREQYYGFFEGMDAEQAWRLIGGPHGYPTRQELLRKVDIDTVKDWMNEADPFHVAESSDQYWKRIMKGFKQIRSLQNADNVLLVNHGFNIRSFAGKFGKDFDLGTSPKNGSISVLKLDNDSIKCTDYNKMNID
jgi:probable phosphoglycerate mutase